MYNDVIERLTRIAANDDLTAEQFNAVQDAIIALQAAQQSVERTHVDIGDGIMVDPLILGAILD